MSTLHLLATGSVVGENSPSRSRRVTFHRRRAKSGTRKEFA